MSYRVRLMANDISREVYLYNGWNDYNTPILDYAREIGVMREDGNFSMKIDDFDTLIELLMKCHNKLGDDMWDLKPDTPYEVDPMRYIGDLCSNHEYAYCMTIPEVVRLLSREACIKLDFKSKHGYRFINGGYATIEGW